MKVGLINPLPRSLHHYEHALSAVLNSTGVDVFRLSTTDIEVGGVLRKARAILSTTLDRRRVKTPPVDHRLVLWPAYGYLDPLRWMKVPTDIVLHDPEPLRRQLGLGPRSASIARSCAERPWIVHSVAALEAVHARGLPARLLPLPMLTPQNAWNGGGTALVLGQYKDARDLSLLGALAALLRGQGLRPVIAGRGWPTVDGWGVSSRFLTEVEFTNLLSNAGVLLLPYARIFQSDVAVRAAELGVPTVGPRRSNLPDLYGADWAGLIEQGAPPRVWAAAVASVRAADSAELFTRVSVAYSAVVSAWAGYGAQDV